MVVVHIVVTERRVETVGSVFMVCFFKLKRCLFGSKSYRD